MSARSALCCTRVEVKKVPLVWMVNGDLNNKILDIIGFLLT